MNNDDIIQRIFDEARAADEKVRAIVGPEPEARLIETVERPSGHATLCISHEGNVARLSWIRFTPEYEAWQLAYGRERLRLYREHYGIDKAAT